MWLIYKKKISIYILIKKYFHTWWILAEKIQFCSRTHNCGELTESHVGTSVIICGWLEFSRMTKFFTLRDGYGSTQVIIPENVSIGLIFIFYIVFLLGHKRRVVGKERWIYNLTNESTYNWRFCLGENTIKICTK